MDPSPSPEIPLPDRLAALADKAQEAAAPRIPQSNAALLDHCLSTLESLLDPQSTTTTTTTDETNCCRCHQEPTPTSTSTKPPPLTNPRSASPELNPSLVNSRLTDLLEEVSQLNREWEQRRKEALRIYGGFRQRCQDLEARLAEREGEVEELREDVLDDSVELEGLRGTVRGLEYWVRGCRHELGAGQDDGMVLEGVTAWIRGWKDMEEGFCVRDRVRERKRRRRRDDRARWRMDMDEGLPPLRDCRS
ncbi:hypothetical protein PHISP_07050 [Aspergillus sp. HF37]|nr:hypothetical protein PHISP_07050 [Aspergillus sp. HF37]